MFINKGQDDQMEIFFFKKDRTKMFGTYLATIMTAGTLRLIFHWIPHWSILATCKECTIGDAETILIKEIFESKYISYYVKALEVLTAETVQKQKNDYKKSLNLLVDNVKNPKISVHFGNEEFRQLDRLLMFSCKKVIYIWDCRKSEFIKLPTLDKGVTNLLLHKNQGLTIGEQFTRRLIYGSNKLIVKDLSVVALLFLEVLSPFSIFQVASIILWFFDGYFSYAVAIVVMSLFGTTVTVRQLYKNQIKLKSAIKSSDVCTILSKNGNESISTEFLVPGDVLVIPPQGCHMYCDAILLNGSCVVNESMLTGESLFVTKFSLPNLPESVYDYKKDTKYTLFSGTQIVQSAENVLALVIRTGFSTLKGKLIRDILYPPPVDFKLEKDSYKFLTLMAGVALVGFIYSVTIKVMRGAYWDDLLIQSLVLITIVVPPALPAAMTVGRLYAQNRLEKKKIFCISPRTINVSGTIDCVCFDKTGTLTENGLNLFCVLPIKEKYFHIPVKNVSLLTFDCFLYGLVSCHSLTMVDEKVGGDPLDLRIFESTKWIMQDRATFKPPKQNSDKLEVHIVREFPFSSEAQRMGVIIQKFGRPHFDYYCKGSPEMILNFVKKDSVPDDFQDILNNYSRQGYRVIALAHKQLKMSYTKINRIKSDIIGRNLTLLGLVILENRLKSETASSIQALNQANIRVIMVTGDNILTAISVARGCDIITSSQSVIIVDVDNSTPPQLYYNLTETQSKYFGDYNNTRVMNLETIESQINDIATNTTKNYRFAMTGKVWEIVKKHYPKVFPKLVTRGTIFARMLPKQKQKLVQELQNLGYCVAMCGDGANDCGALKTAHTGISLSEDECSIASPFASVVPNISCVLEVIREGRAALVTSFGIFKYMAGYSLCQFVSIMILYSIESNFTTWEFLYIDLFIVAIFSFFFVRTKAYEKKLVKEAPLSSLLSVCAILSLVLQMLLIIGVQVGVFENLKLQNWYIQFDARSKKHDDDVACVENYVMFTVSSFQYIILAVAFSKGSPYRKSILSNYGFLFSAVTLTVFTIYLTLWPSKFFANLFELVVPEDFSLRLNLVISVAFNFVLSIFIEKVVIDYIIFKKLGLDKPKTKYSAIESKINLETDWPRLVFDLKSTVPTCTTVTERQAKINED